MEIRCKMNPYISMDELSEPWNINYKLIKEEVEDKKEEDKEKEEKSSLEMTLSLNKKNK